MDKEEKVIRHLEMIQNIIDRMARNSFLLKGWAMALIVASAWLLARNGDYEIGAIKWIAIVVVITLWALDGYFLRQERLFRKLYDKIRKEKDTDFSMNPSEFMEQVPNWGDTCWGKPMPNTLLIFYAPLMTAVFFCYNRKGDKP